MTKEKSLFKEDRTMDGPLFFTLSSPSLNLINSAFLIKTEGGGG